MATQTAAPSSHDTTTVSSYDTSKAYEEEVLPLMEQIAAICEREQIPMLASFSIRFDRATEQAVFSTTFQPKPSRTPAQFLDALRHLFTKSDYALLCGAVPAGETQAGSGNANN